ncbi:insulin receptor substrate 1 [Alligator mississippiensis]|uniref:insulin receptor substrate 1 n=1 Tax=Alligator mississippiensis TaxID=8496 RepID=UPI0003D0B15C|nr:insulin receptor substrate 1 [Alligator mississippiensis]
MASPTEGGEGCFSDVRKVGYLRKPKSMHKRFFVLRAASESGPARLEYYENEKKWRHKSGAPKRSIPLESCFNINKRADSKNKHLVALYTKDEHFAIAADSEPEQESWYQALLQLHNRAKGHHHHHHHHSDVAFGGTGAGLGEAGEDSYGEAVPGPAFKEVWQVILKPKGLGQTKNLIGIYRLCLTNKTISFVKLNSDAAAVVLQLLNIRRCGHSENFFFIEVGRSAVTGPGEFWMQVDDSVVAQNMHETILEAMRAMSEEFRPRSKSQSSSNCSNPISVPLRSRHHVNNPPPSQVGLSRRSRTESVTATSPAGGGGGAGGKPSSFRVRASSDGEGTMSRPASVDGSPVSPSTNRTHSHRHRGSSRLHPPLNHSRSIPMPSSRCSPSATSPVSLSSSSTSGHGSTSDCLFPRRSSASVSGSPSDGGFISSDEYGSSPCDFRSSFRSVTPDSLGHTPPARGDEELNNYICMGGKSASSCCSLAAPNGHFVPRPCHPQQQQSRYPGTPCCSRAGGEEGADLEKGFRKRTHSAGTSPTISHQKTPSQSSAASIEEYTEMLPSYPCGGSRLPSYRHSAFVPTHSYPEECLEMHHLDSSHHRTNSAPHTDDGYMPMSPGVAPVPSVGGNPKGGDYMPMSPKSVSAPQQIINPGRGGRHPQAMVDSNGYMMMSPSGSYSPDGGPAGYGKIWTNGASHHPKLSVESNEGKLPCGGSDYINMSPASGSTTSTPPDCYFASSGPPGTEEAPAQGPAQAHHKPIYSYFSLPRSFKHVQRRTAAVAEDSGLQLRISLSSGRLLYAAEDSSSSTSSDSLGGGSGQDNSHHHAHPLQQQQQQPQLQPQPPHKVDTAVQTKSRLARPTRLSLGGPKASTLPRAREQPPLLLPPEPKSPGEYVNIEFISSEKPVFPLPGSATLSLGLTPAGDEGSEEYMNMDLGTPRAACQAGYSAARTGTVARPGRRAAMSSRDYVAMQLGGGVGGPCLDCVDSPSPSSSDLLLSYADMRTGRTGPEKMPSAALAPPEPRPPAELAAAPPRSSSLMGGPGVNSAFTRVSLSPNRNQSAKVIRADPQGGRRRHSSETFSSTPSSARGVAGSTGLNAPLPYGVGGVGSAEEVKRHSSASFENVWLRPAGGDLGGPLGTTRKEQQVGAGSGFANGLNYIDLDLVKDFNHRRHLHQPQEGTSMLGGKQPPPQQQTKSPNQPRGSNHSSDDSNAYASISFQKREDI